MSIGLHQWMVDKDFSDHPEVGIAFYFPVSIFQYKSVDISDLKPTVIRNTDISLPFSPIGPKRYVLSMFNQMKERRGTLHKVIRIFI